MLNFLLFLISFSCFAMPTLNLDNLTQEKLNPKDNSNLAASLFLYQLALKDREQGGKLFGDNICIQYTKGISDKDPSQNFKLVSADGVFKTNSSKIDSNNEDIERLKKIYGIMRKYFDAIGANPKVLSTGFTDGEGGDSDANRKLGLRRAQSISQALGINRSAHNNYTTENSRVKSGEASRCKSRRVTTVEFDATPKVNQSFSGSYTPEFTMIKDHKKIKKYAMFSALELLAKHNNNIDEVLKSMPSNCNTPSTKKVLKQVNGKAYISDYYRRGNFSKFKKRFEYVFKSKDANIPDQKSFNQIKYMFFKQNYSLTPSGVMQKVYKNKDPKMVTALNNIISNIKKYEASVGSSSSMIKMRALPNSPNQIVQSNHEYDCFDVKGYYKNKHNRPATEDVSSYIKNGKLHISFTRDDFNGHGNDLRCNQCKSGMSLGNHGHISHDIRTGKKFTDKSKVQKFNITEHNDASSSIKLASLNNFNSMASHKSMKVVVIKNCEDPSSVDPFASDNIILTINSLPFKKAIDILPGSKVCVVNMPVVNTCTVEPNGDIKTKDKPAKKYLHYYSLEGKEITLQLTKENLKSLDYLEEVVNSPQFDCTGLNKPKNLKADEIINQLSCDSKGITPPNESNFATEKECKQGYIKKE